MAATYEEFLADFYDNWNLGRGSYANQTQDVNNAQLEHNAANDHLAQQHIINALWHTIYGVEYLLDTYQYPYPRYNIIKLFELINDRLNVLEAAEPPEVTWQTICEAWAKNNFEGRAVTIGFIDRMRQLLWNEPYYIAFASRPEEQEF